MSNKNSVKQGGWWYEVIVDEKRYNVLLDVPENTKPLTSSEIVDIYDEEGLSINVTLDEDEYEIVFNSIDFLLNESGLLD